MAGLAPRAVANGYRRERIAAYALLTLFLLYSLLPLYYLAVSATKTNTQLFSSFGLWFAEDLNLGANLRALFGHDDGVFLLWMRNSVVYALASGFGAAAICTAAGYALSKFRFPGRRVMYAAILGAVMVPNTALVIPLFLLFANLGITDTWGAVILPSVVFPLGVYLMKVYIDQAVPDELLDAARIDGASEAGIFASIVVRLAMPGIVTVLLLAFTTTWNNYFLPLVMLSSPELMPMTVGLAQWNALASAGSGGQALFSIVIAGALVGVLPVIAMFLLLQRFWQGGLATGSVK
ncbi:carbohydrate ABC transporter permease [Histidinibacterium lentulum]|uniref:Carbohydrate ABC transporter permease n=1 Tax=Histidinibacterium lentulum TaxID=2480588 RepID=A0A3N2QYJ1_9RHOB|nr:carbohydrate ABC transporter permease [Histidinibacterium lentulum]ROU00166.1 carbohydrate ABC transporter permease [Histidinibacterium lentulum]